ncbi:MAG: LysM peptidoglycan-binding domain-containing protein [Anaerolineae bacterium]|nr:LysM peptidoglycan-binding domain-containing protein [Anaerolineae bacterium]
MQRSLMLIVGLWVVSLMTGCAFNVAHSNPEATATPAASSTLLPTEYPTVPITLNATAPATDTPTPIAVAGQYFTTASRESISRKLLDKTNHVRAAAGLSVYTLNTALNAAAQDQAEWMATTGEASHIRPDGSKPATRAALAGYPNSWSVTEIIYIGGIATEDHAWDFWTTSSIHYAQLTSPRHQEAGIGMAHSDTFGQAYVMIFGISESVSTPIPTLPPLQAGQTTHVVQPGETLFIIARQYGLTLDALAATNHMRVEDVIYVGQTLIIPAATTGTPAATQATLTPTIPTLPPSPTISLPPTITPTHRIHIVQRGETLYRIAVKYGVPLDKLIAVNGIRNPERIEVGQQIIIP